MIKLIIYKNWGSLKKSLRIFYYIYVTRDILFCSYSLFLIENFILRAVRLSNWRKSKRCQIYRNWIKRWTCRIKHRWPVKKWRNCRKSLHDCESIVYSFFINIIISGCSNRRNQKLFWRWTKRTECCWKGQFVWDESEATDLKFQSSCCQEAWECEIFHGKAKSHHKTQGTIWKQNNRENWEIVTQNRNQVENSQIVTRAHPTFPEDRGK